MRNGDDDDDDEDLLVGTLHFRRLIDDKKIFTVDILVYDKLCSHMCHAFMNI